MKLSINGGWDITLDKFPKIEATAHRDGGSRKVFIPLTGGLETLEEGNFFIRKTAKGDFALSKGTDNTDRLLYFGTVKDGFRGSSGIHEKNKATIIAQVSCSSACRGETHMAAVIEENKPLVCYKKGRGVNEIYVVNYLGEIMTLSAEEADVYFNGISDEGEVI